MLVDFPLQGRGSILARKVMTKPMPGGHGCFLHQVKAAICRAAARTAIHRALVRAGEPPARVPHDKTVRRTVLSPLLRFFTEKEFRPVRRATKGFAFGFHHL